MTAMVLRFFVYWLTLFTEFIETAHSGLLGLCLDLEVYLFEQGSGLATG